MASAIHPGRRSLWLFGVAAIVALVSLVSPATHAQTAARTSPSPALASGYTFAEQNGEALYGHICQACHMPDGKGATGAGTYPALAGDKALEAGRYPLFVVVNGQRAMPPLGSFLNDDQIAAVVNYVRTHFGNDYRDVVTADDVKAVRR
jgi:mono/diheme cytochrome c family protein